MPSLKALRGRIASVRATRKITQAMRMVAASKLRRAQDAAAEARPYADVLGAMLRDVAASTSAAPPTLTGRPEVPAVALIVAAADRGLCGAFNASIVRKARARARELEAQGRKPLWLPVGRKARDAAVRLPGVVMLDADARFPADANADVAARVAARVLAAFDEGAIGGCEIVYARFQSALAQTPTVVSLIPAGSDDGDASEAGEAEAPATAGGVGAYEFEPSAQEALEALLQRNVVAQILRALLENAASEQGARMTAMDSATRNAGDMIDRLTLVYNRARQATITRELIEVISGADAL